MQNLLEFLQREDKEDSEDRARYRGESISQINKDLYVVKEEVNVPDSSPASSIEVPPPRPEDSKR